MRIFLLGFMGAGKTTVGKMLATRLELPFVDLDESVESKLGKGITEIFNTEGEAFFRKTEAACLDEMSAQGEFVMATGGGTPAWKGNMELMNSRGLTVYLEQEEGLLLHRISQGKMVRPLATDKPEERKAALLRLLNLRRPFYERAQLRMKGVGRQGGDIDALARLLRAHYSR